MTDYEEKDGEKRTKLDGLDLGTAKLNDMVEALKRMECENRGLLDDIRVLRVRLADENVKKIKKSTCCRLVGLGNKKEHVARRIMFRALSYSSVEQKVRQGYISS